MAYVVGDKVKWYGEIVTIIKVKPTDRMTCYVFALPDGSTNAAYQDELEWEQNRD